LLHSGYGRVLVLFVSSVLINFACTVSITPAAQFLNYSRFILFSGFVLVSFICVTLFIVLWEVAHAAYFHLLACKITPSDGVEAQEVR
jgi:hypothetical protein